ncbi:MAG: methyltransferase domain-containing protein [Candidatus Krumholzibacteriia bacterium]
MKKGIVRHFSRIASRYNSLRITDLEVVEFIADKLRTRLPARVADVGCGSGRYDIELLRRLGQGLDLICVDRCHAMLRMLHRQLRRRQLDGCRTVRAAAHGLPFMDGDLDGVLTLNAIHHLAARSFLRECERALRPGGLLMIYTRWRSQNARNIWGRFFPSFSEKEVRLFEREEFEGLIAETPGLGLEAVRDFRYGRQGSLDDLLERARNHHYSTFTLYTSDEFETAIRQFEENVLRCFSDPERVTWQDENTLLVVRRAVRTCA